MIVTDCLLYVVLFPASALPLNIPVDTSTSRLLSSLSSAAALLALAFKPRETEALSKKKGTPERKKTNKYRKKD